MPNDILPDFDSMVATYEAHAEPGTGAFATPLVALAAVRSGERALDIATGTGVLLPPLLAAGARVTATDLSVPMIARIAERYPVAARAMDGQALDLADGAFDVALSLFGVMLFPDYVQGVREMVRVVRPGGRIAIGSWSAPAAPMQLLAAAVERSAPAALPLAMPAGMDVLGHADRTAAMLGELGLVDIRSEALTLRWPAPTRELAAQAPVTLAQMPAWRDLDDAARADAQAAMHAVADTTPHFDSTALLTVATRR